MSVAPVPLVISYIDPDGVTWNLSDLSMSNGYVCSAIAGIDGFPVMMQIVPLLDGTAVPNILLPQPGTIGLAILVTRPASDNESDYYALLDRLTRAFWNNRNSAPAPGTLIIQRPDGTARQISVYTTSGLDTPDVGKDNKMVYSFSLATPDPWWSDLVPTILNFNTGVNNGILPVLPVDLNGAAVIGNIVVNNAGNMFTFPTWTITGPGTPTLRNNTTGRAWSLNTAIPAGQQVQVVTKRGQQAAVNITTGANIWGQLVISSPRDLWPLAAGNNSISITMTGATSATQVSMSYVNRWSRSLWQ